MSNQKSELECAKINVEHLEFLSGHIKKLLESYSEKNDEFYVKSAMARLLEMESYISLTKRFILPPGVKEFDFLNDNLGDLPSGKHGGKNLGTIGVPDGGISDIGTLQLPEEN